MHGFASYERVARFSPDPERVDCITLLTLDNVFVLVAFG
jgi:hypothetical protein